MSLSQQLSEALIKAHLAELTESALRARIEELEKENAMLKENLLRCTFKINARDRELEQKAEAIRVLNDGYQQAKACRHENHCATMDDLVCLCAKICKNTHTTRLQYPVTKETLRGWLRENKVSVCQCIS